jgi:hypothetical protein
MRTHITAPHEHTSGPAADVARSRANRVLRLQRQLGNATTAHLVEEERERKAGELVRGVVQTAGEPLPETARASLEASMGTNLSDVRVHYDAAAAASAKAVDAHAYTSGTHIVFGSGRYNIGSSEGDHTLAHEVAHVVQQRQGPVSGRGTEGGLQISEPGDAFEVEADRIAAAAPALDAAPVQRLEGFEEPEEPEKEPAEG